MKNLWVWTKIIEKISNTKNLFGGKSPFDFSPVGKISHFVGHLDASLTIIVGKELGFSHSFPTSVGKAPGRIDFQKPHILLGIITIIIDIHSENIYFSHFSY